MTDTTQGAEAFAYWATPQDANLKWLLSWTTREDLLNGPVVHRGDLKRLFEIHSTPWGHATFLRGLVCLARRRPEYAALVIRTAHAQARLQEEDGRYRFAGHEDDRYSSLVHNAIADLALIEAAEFARETGQEGIATSLLEGVRKNVDGYLYGKLHRESNDLFVVNERDYYAGSASERYVLNMNSAASCVLIRLGRLLDNQRYLKTARHIVDWIIALQERAGRSEAGAFPYADRGEKEFITIYSAIAMWCLLEGKVHCGWEDCTEPLRSGANWLDRQFDEESALVIHGVFNGSRRRDPRFVAGGAIVLSVLNEVSRVTKEPLPQRYAQRVAAVLARQHPCGGVGSFEGYDTRENGRRNGRGGPAWEDTFPTTSWNAHLFQFLVNAEMNEGPERSWEGTAARATKCFVWVDRRQWAAVVSWWPWRGAGLIVWRKRAMRALVCISVHGLASLVREWRSTRGQRR